MCGNILCVAAVLLGIDAGWQRLPDGGLEYQIQIEPDLVENVGSSGVLIQSDVPPEARDIRSFRITVGKAQLPQESLPPAEVAAPAEAATPKQGNATANKPAADPFLPSPSAAAIEFGSNWVPPMDRPELPAADVGQPRPGGATPSPADTAETALPAAALPLDASPGQEPATPETSAIPRTLSPDPRGKPLDVQPAVHLQPTQPVAPAGAGPSADKTASSASDRPWLAMTLTLLALFASLGGNVFLVWLAADFRRRYRTLAGRLGEVATG